MVKRIVKYGNSQAIVLPREILEPLGLDTDSYVDVVVSDGHIAIRPVDMVLRISDEDRTIVDTFYRENESVFKALAE